MDALLSTTEVGDYNEVERLLYEYWSIQCPLLFAPNADQPWDNQVDETRIGKILFH
jgi:hypothetical protein